MAREKIAWIARLLVGGVFCYSGWNKLTHPIEEFQYAIEQYQLFSSEWARMIAHVLPWVELVFGVFVLLGFLRSLSAFALSLLSVSFIALLGSSLARGIEIQNCGCFGKNIHLTPEQAIIVDGFLLILLLFLSSVKNTPLELDNWL